MRTRHVLHFGRVQLALLGLLAQLSLPSSTTPAGASESAGRGAGPDITAAILPDERIARGEEWRFFRGRSEPSGGTLDWTAPDFDDGAWEKGRAGFGYADGDDATLLSDMRTRYSSVYIRREFEVSDPDRVATLTLEIDFDDGFIAFLNGREIARANAGPDGSVPAHDDVATASREAGTPLLFTVVGAASLLAPGKNLLAVVGLNDDPYGSDFSLHPALRSDGALSEGCPGDFYVGSPDVLLAGTAPAGTSAVRVEGALAAFDPSSGGWSYRASLPPGGGSLTAEALDATGGVLSSRTLRAIGVRPLGGRIEADVVLPDSESPYLLVERLVVAPGHRLTLEPGCEVLIRPEEGLLVLGEIQARGTAEKPIRFTRVPCQENWGFFSFEGARGENSFRFCEWSYGGGDPGCLTLTESDLELDACTLRDIDGEGVHAVRCTTRIRNCLTERTREALSLDFGDTLVESCTVRDAVEKSDLIDLNGSHPPARIAFNHIYGTTDDGIDVDGGELVIEGNVIHGCGDQAMSLVGVGTSTVRFNVCYANAHGLSVKDSHVCLAEHNTFAFNSDTGARAIEKTAGRGGGAITLRDSILWGNAVQLFVDAKGTIEVAYSDVEGGLIPGLGNLSADPRFVDAAAGDFRLAEGSPCIGVSSDGDDLGALPFDAPPGAYPRGDSNGDGRLDVADAIAALAFLFQGGTAPPCREVADANADRDVDVADPVFILLHLFAGGPAPTPQEVRCSG